MKSNTCRLWTLVLLLTLVLPVPVAAAVGVKAIAAGGNHSLALRTDGTLWAWGCNSSGELGLGDTTARLTPTRVGKASDWIAIAAGRGHSLGLQADGSLWAWGYNYHGQLGLGFDDTTDRHIPTRVPRITPWQAIAAGRFFSLAIDNGDYLYAWGDNYYGQLGLGHNTEVHSPDGIGPSTWKAINAGQYHVLGISKFGLLLSCGMNNYGQLGLLGISGDVNLFQWVTPIADGMAVAAGEFHSLAIRGDGSLWAWGNNALGQLGLGDWDTTDRHTPVRVGTGSDWKAVAAGSIHSLAIQTDGTLWAWGAAMVFSDSHLRFIPTQVGTAADWTALAAQGFQGLGLKADGSLWAWGRNAQGQLGLNDTIDMLRPWSGFCRPRPGCLCCSIRQ